MSTQSEVSSADPEIDALRSRIDDLAVVVDGQKARSAMAMGAAVFLLLLAALGAYDLTSGKSGIWRAVGIDESSLRSATIAFGAIGLFLLATVLLRNKTRHRAMESELSELEGRLAERLDRSTPADLN